MSGCALNDAGGTCAGFIHDPQRNVRTDVLSSLVTIAQGIKGALSAFASPEASLGAPTRLRRASASGPDVRPGARNRRAAPRPTGSASH
jgi:hypothetical protein